MSEILIHAIVNKQKSKEFIYKCREVFDCPELKYQRMKKEGYWKIPTCHTIFIVYKVRTPFNFEQWKSMLKQVILIEPKVISDVPKEIAMGCYTLTQELEANIDALWVDFTLPKECISDNDKYKKYK